MPRKLCGTLCFDRYDKPDENSAYSRPKLLALFGRASRAMTPANTANHDLA